MREPVDFVREVGNLSAVYAESVVGYAEQKRQITCRQSDESYREATSFAENMALAV
ncbi:MAG: hypothetical protein SPI30_02700 [Prevotella sp.]|nr:hypothetical protein [Prevotella sp.]